MASSETPVNEGPVSGTIYESFREAAARYPEKTALMYKDEKEYKGITYKELNDMVNAVAASLANLGIEKGDRVAIYSYNRPEWAVADLSVLKLGGIVVGLYHALSASTLAHTINDSGSRLIFVENAQRLARIDSIRKETPCLTGIVAFDAEGTGAQKGVLSFSKLKKAGEPVDESVLGDPAPVSPDDTATIIYTSGTTGEPKGAVLSHRNIAFNAIAGIREFKITPEDIFLSFLPLPHVFERVCGYYSVLFAGASIAYAENLATIARNMQEVRPTVLLAVPRVIERAYDKAAKKAAQSSLFKRALLFLALRNLRARASLKHEDRKAPLYLRLKCAVYDYLAASKFRKIAGGRLRVIVTGGAALDRQVAETFHALGFNIAEGYGLTETSAVVTCNTVQDNRPGTVGKPIDNVEIKIGENDEILVRGPNVIREYFGRPEETAKAIDGDGWFHTGDKGRFDKHGNLIIAGRIKEIIVTSFGKNIAPGPIEAKITKSGYIEYAVLCGDNRKFITALVVPEKEAVERYGRENSMAAENYAELLKRDEIIKLIASEIDKATAGLSPYEKAKKFTLLPESFTIENGLLTPTLKLRRGKIFERYKNEIAAMYGEVD